MIPFNAKLSARTRLFLRFLKRGGQSAVEFVIILPIVIFAIACVLESGALGVRGILTSASAFEAARSVRTGDVSGARSSAMHELPDLIFKDVRVELDEDFDRVAVKSEGRSFSNLSLFDRSKNVRREAPSSQTLRRGLSNELLSGGDTPSPYCNVEGGYGLCGYSR